MPKIALTEISIKALKPTGAQVTYWDASLPNFGVRVGKLRKTFVVLIGSTTRRRMTLGTYPELSIAKARQAARQQLYSPDTMPEPKTPTATFGEALDLFLATYSKQRHRPSTARENKRILERHFLPVLSTRKMDAIKPGELTPLLDRLQSTPSEADHAFRVLRTFLNFCVKRGYIETSPLSRIEAPAKQPSRERTLSPEELSKVWQQAKAIGYPYGTIVQLLMLCGQRTGETAALRWEWIDREGISFPSSITKNGRASRIPYGPLTQSVLATIPRTGQMLFPARGYTDKPFVGFGVSKLLLDKCGVEQFTHHDLRRSYSTIMASPAVGAPIHVLEKLLNHSSGVLRGVAAIYNRYSYWDEMREAVTAYEGWFAKAILAE
jgi:integrase